MKKLYRKKLFSILLHTIVCYVIYLIGFSLISLIANFFTNPFIKLVFLLGIPLMIVLIRVYNRRLENAELRRSYLGDANRDRFAVADEWRCMLKFPHFLAELFAFATILFPVTLIISITLPTTWWIRIFVGLLSFGLLWGIYFIVDFALWLFIHKAWRKEYIG